MKMLFVGGDKRQKYMVEEFIKKGYDITLLGFDKLNTNIKKTNTNKVDVSIYDAILFPVSGVYRDSTVKAEYNSELVFIPISFLKSVNKKCKIFTGIMTYTLKKMLTVAKKSATILMESKDVTFPNGIITVEGIIKDLIENSNETIYGSNIMIIGYGNIGERLTHLLKVMDANLTVVVKKTDEIDKVKNEKVILTRNIKEELGYQSIIVNTAPELVLREEELESVNKNSYILDIASLPGGIDFKCANQKEIKNKHLLGIPGNIAPLSAGMVLSKKINAIIKEEKE